VLSASDLDTAASEYQAYYGLTFSKEMPLLRALISRLDCRAGHRAANQRRDTSVRRPRATGRPWRQARPDKRTPARRSLKKPGPSMTPESVGVAHTAHRPIATGCTRWGNDRCPSSAHRWSCYSGVNAGWGTDDAFRLRKLITERGASGRFAQGWRRAALTLGCFQRRPGRRRWDLRLREIQRRGGDHGAHSSYDSQHAHRSALYS
jgi:hypothetical protein